MNNINKYSFISSALKSNLCRIFCVILCIFLSISLIFGINNALFPTLAHAENSDEYEARVQSLAARVDIIQTQINDCQDRIDRAAKALVEATEAKEEAQEAYDFACDRIEQLKPQLQEAAQNSYGAYLAIELLNNIVGNKLISQAVFNELAIKLLTNHDDYLSQEIVNLYYIEENSYNDILRLEETAKFEIGNSNKAKDELNLAYSKIMEELNVASGTLNDIKANEEKHGKPGPGLIFGNGIFAHPCPEGTLSSPFGESRESENGGYYHKGTDFSAPEGTPIYAAEDGIVVESTFDDDYNGGRGMWIVISHGDGVVTQYMHCSHVYYEKGQTIKKGDHIANVGNTGDSYGSHVHFQVEVNGEPVDGMDYLKDKDE